jgi:RNA polymerase sigma-70 factor, ECF subfamily
MDFITLHQCFREESVDDPILIEFLHGWLPNKVKYLANEVAISMNTKLKNDDYEELTGQLICIVYEKIEKIDPGISFRSWICKAIKFLTQNFIRKKKAILVDTSESNNLISLQQEKGIKDSPFTETQLENLYSAIQALPRKQYTTFILKYYEGYSSQEIAALVGCTVSQVDQRNLRARKKLQSLLKDFFSEFMTLQK